MNRPILYNAVGEPEYTPTPCTSLDQQQDYSELRNQLDRTIAARDLAQGMLRDAIAECEALRRAVAELKADNKHLAERWDRAESEKTALKTALERANDECTHWCEQYAEGVRALPCGSHPRLMSMGQPAKFTGGCGAIVPAHGAIVCADCGAWYCSRACISKHFENEPNEAIATLEKQLSEAREKAAREAAQIAKENAGFYAAYKISERFGLG